MESTTSNGSDVPPPPTTTGGVPRPRRGLRAFGRMIGWSAAVLAVPVGIALSWITSWLGNCELGFFGETGPAEGAGVFTLGDLGAPSIGWLVAVVPWGVVAIWNRDPARRRTALLVIAGTTVAVLVLVLLPQFGGVSYWEQVCT